MSTKLGIGLLLWEVFAFTSALTLAVLYPLPGSSWNADIFEGVFLSVTFLGWTLFFLVTGLVDYAKRRSDN